MCLHPGTAAQTDQFSRHFPDIATVSGAFTAIGVARRPRRGDLTARTLLKNNAFSESGFIGDSPHADREWTRTNANACCSCRMRVHLRPFAVPFICASVQSRLFETEPRPRAPSAESYVPCLELLVERFFVQVQETQTLIGERELSNTFRGRSPRSKIKFALHSLIGGPAIRLYRCLHRAQSLLSDEFYQNRRIGPLVTSGHPES